MLKRLLILFALLLFMAGTLAAQDHQDWEGWQFYAGGNWLTTNANPELPPLAVTGHVGGYGWEAAVTQYVPSHPWFGAVVDLSGSYGRHGTLIIPANSLGSANPPDTLVIPNAVNLSGYAFLAGPTFRFSKPNAPVQPFVRVLVGGVHSYASLNSKGKTAIFGYATNGDTEVGFGGGGGFDWMMTKRWGVRAQVDYIEANFKDPYRNLQREVRGSFGVVLHL